MPTLAYNDFNYFVSSTGIEAIQDIGAPLVATGSLRIRRALGSANEQCNFAPKTPDFAQGTIRGRLRALFKEVTILSAASQHYGLLCMQSQRNLISSGTAYMARFRASVVEIVKVPAGLTGGGQSILATSATIVPGTGINALQIEWAYIPETGGTFLFAYHGTATDFSNLTQVASVNDQSAPYTTSVTEGGFFHDGASGFDFDIRIDQMTLAGV